MAKQISDWLYKVYILHMRAFNSKIMTTGRSHEQAQYGSIMVEPHKGFVCTISLKDSTDHVKYISFDIYMYS